MILTKLKIIKLLYLSKKVYKQKNKTNGKYIVSIN